MYPDNVSAIERIIFVIMYLAELYKKSRRWVTRSHFGWRDL